MSKSKTGAGMAQGQRRNSAGWRREGGMAKGWRRAWRRVGGGTSGMAEGWRRTQEMTAKGGAGMVKGWRRRDGAGIAQGWWSMAKGVCGEDPVAWSSMSLAKYAHLNYHMHLYP